MLKQPAMGDNKAVSSKPPSARSGESQAKPSSSDRDSATLPVAENVISAPTFSTAPPTDDIDSEWPSDDDEGGIFEAPPAATKSAAPSSVQSAPVNQASAELLSDDDDDAETQLVSPSFPADPGLPRDLRSHSGVPSSRPSMIPEVPPSKRDMDTVPAAPQASRPPSSVNANSSARLRAAAEAAAQSAKAPIISRSEPAVASVQASVPPISSEPVREARHTDDPQVHSLARPDLRPPSRAPLIAALLVAAGVALWLLRPASPAKEAKSELPSAPSAAAEVKATPAEPQSVPVAPAPAAAPVASAEVAAAATSDSKPEPAPTTEAPAAATSAAADAPAPNSEGKYSVVISVRPPQARVFYRGKEVGHPPVTVEVEAGKRRSFEVALPGFMTRKVVIDGSKSEVFVGLRPDPAAPVAVPAH